MPMRRLTTGLALAGTLLLCGCSTLNRGPKADTTARHSRWDGRQPTSASLVAYLNENSRQVQALRCEDVTLDCKAGSDSGAIPTARLDCQKPRCFRLTGRAVGQPVVDIGSNDQEFWYWIGKADPRVFHCTHEAVARGGVRMPFPFQPDMVMCALGIAEYDPAKQYQVNVQPRTVELIEAVQSPAGKPLQKITIFQRAQATGHQPQVLGYMLRDQQGHEVCRATVTDVVHDARTGVELPRRIQFNWPAEKLEMKMKLDGLRVVPPEPDRLASLYSRRNLASNPGFDLERWQQDSPTGRVERVTNPPR